jgi:hypothetical protein
MRDADLNFEKRAERMAAMARQRSDVEEGEEPAPKPKMELLQFPLWPEPERAAPNAFFRSALFGVVQRGARYYCKQEKLATWPDVDLKGSLEKREKIVR